MVAYYKYIIHYIKQAYQHQPANFPPFSWADYGYCVETQKEILWILKSDRKRKSQVGKKSFATLYTFAIFSVCEGRKAGLRRVLSIHLFYVINLLTRD